jgi:hypothetical protein
MKFRKKPVVIDAMEYRGNNRGLLLSFIGGSAHFNDLQGDLLIRTLEGVMVVSPGDWVIKGIKGEFYPCKPDIFAATYEPV